MCNTLLLRVQMRQVKRSKTLQSIQCADELKEKQTRTHAQTEHRTSARQTHISF